MSVGGYLEPWCPLSSFSLKIILLDLWMDKCDFMRCPPQKRTHSVVEMRLIKRKFQKSSGYSRLHFPEHSHEVVGDGGLQKEISLHVKEL